ncbi:TolC family protein [Agathobaculum sp.]|uniref:TolC family protein n=1 Tax=Agathobaculum sp. TaxID=2048138 RepID=UPI002A7F7C67|nr:TolC family protein [Agathobaculum sp.]MCI5704022.1 TolC family protein [Pseudoflavonifractor sp.]MDY3618918.1 TolC family protein [Agathobaculum sp.]
MKKRMLALLLLAALTTGLCAYATETGGFPDPEPPNTAVDPEAAPADTPAQPQETGPSEDAPKAQPGAQSKAKTPVTGKAPALAVAQQNTTVNVPTTSQENRAITFSGIDSTVRSNNLTIKSLEQTLAGIDAQDVEIQFWLAEAALESGRAELNKQINDMQDTLDRLETSSGGDPALTAALKGMLQGNISQMKSSLADIERNLKDLEDQQDAAEETKDNALVSTKKALENTGNMLVYNAENLYISIAAQQLNRTGVVRQIAAADRKLSEMETRYRLGQISQLDLEQVRSGRSTAASGQQSLTFAIDGMRMSLGMLLGWDVGTKADISGLAPVTDTQLRSMNYENDLKEALANSYTIWQKKDALRQANNDYEDDVASTLHAVNAAKLDLENAEKSVAHSFLTLFNTVTEKQRLVQVAEDTYKLQVRLFDAADKKYGLGQISKNELDDAQDELDSAKDAITSAQYELFTAYNQYQWAKRGCIAS